MLYIRSKNARAKCPVAGKYIFCTVNFYFPAFVSPLTIFLFSGCPKMLQAQKVLCDPVLLMEIDEMRAMSKQTAMTDVIEDCTALDEEDCD
jgi:hypothetical protein